MQQLALLDSHGHARLTVDVGNAGGRHFVQIVAEEFLPAMLDYPILFTKHPDTGRFYAGVVMGLEAGDNLLAPDGVLPGYRPADLVREGFYLDEGRIAIDSDNPVFQRGGEPLFDASGNAAPALRRVQQALHLLGKGLPETDAFIARMVEHQLLEPIDISFDFDDGNRIRLDGLYALSLDKAHALQDAPALDLLRRGDLQLLYAQSASLRQLGRLARIRNDRPLPVPS